MLNRAVIIKLSFIVSAALCLSTNLAMASTYSWSSITPPGGFSMSWSSSVMSSNGNRIAVLSDTGLATSTDGGTTWSFTPGLLTSGSSIAASSDGLKLFITTNDGSGHIATSSDGGLTFANLSTAPGAPVNLAVDSIAASSDGSKLAAVVGYLGSASTAIYTSTNSGSTWTSNTVPSKSWRVVASSQDGQKLFAGINQSSASYIATSTDGGTTWALLSTVVPGTKRWNAIAVSADGSKAIAAVGRPDTAGPGIVLRYSDTTGWTSLSTALGTHNWQGVAMSSDGTKMAAVDNDAGDFWISQDGGVTWASQSVSASTRHWATVSISSDGTRIVAGDSAANIYIGTTSFTAPTISNVASTTGQTTATITWTTTGILSTSTVSYGLDTAYGTSVNSDSLVTSHSISLTGLTPDTTYHFAASSTDAYGNSATSADYTFKTSAVPVTVAPTTPSSAPAFLPGGTSASQQQANLRAIYARNGLVCPVTLCPASPSGVPSTAVLANFSFVQDFSVGNVDQDVKNLQVALNGLGFVVSSTGAGSQGHETTTFGPATRAAIIKFQKANNITPAVGYFGPKTRAALSKLLLSKK